MMALDIITNVYNGLALTVDVKRLIYSFDDDGCGEVDEELVNCLIHHMTRTYCRMRGEDFVRKMMQHGFKNRNLGKGVCPALAIISNLEV